MNAYVQNVIRALSGIWPRIIGFSETPSLLVLALIVNLITVLPTAFRIHKENPGSEAQGTASVQSTSARTSSE